MQFLVYCIYSTHNVNVYTMFTTASIMLSFVQAKRFRQLFTTLRRSVISHYFVIVINQFYSSFSVIVDYFDLRNIYDQNK